jgi:hypothetical protein
MNAARQRGHFFHRRLMDLRGLLKNGVRRQLEAGMGKSTAEPTDP